MSCCRTKRRPSRPPGLTSTRIPLRSISFETPGGTFYSRAEQAELTGAKLTTSTDMLAASTRTLEVGLPYMFAASPLCSASSLTMLPAADEQLADGSNCEGCQGQGST